MPKPRDLTSTGRREQILDEAQRLFVAHGAQHVSTRHIAQAVGISQPSLYAHFANRDAIAVELCCRAFDQLHARLVAARHAAAATALDRLGALGRTYIEFGLTNSAAYQIAFMHDLPSPTSPEKGKVLTAGVRSFSVLRELFGAPGMTEIDASAAAQSAWASMHGLVALLLVRGEFPFVDVEVLIARHLETICLAAAPALKEIRN